TRGGLGPWPSKFMRRLNPFQWSVLPCVMITSSIGPSMMSRSCTYSRNTVGLLPPSMTISLSPMSMMAESPVPTSKKCTLNGRSVAVLAGFSGVGWVSRVVHALLTNPSVPFDRRTVVPAGYREEQGRLAAPGQLSDDGAVGRRLLAYPHGINDSIARDDGSV